MVSSAPVPKVQHICRESRALNLYQRFYRSEEDPRAAYIWVDFDIDIIDIGRAYFPKFKDCAHSIRRLMFEAENTCESWYYFTARELVIFDNLMQCFVRAADGWESWPEAFTEHCWSCDADNLYIIDTDRGRMMSVVEVDQWMDDDGRYDKEKEGGWTIGQSAETAVVTFPTGRRSGNK
jgi:hypothetical protein